MSRFQRVFVIGLDGLDPRIVESLLQAGELPNLARLAAAGGWSRVATTTPAQTPVAWSTFATGLNPGGHGIYDFIRRDPQTYLPDLALNRYEQKNAFLPPKAVNLRRGTPLWEVLATGGVPSTVLRCPCTYPPDTLKGRLLSGMGVPDIRGGLGTSTFYSLHPDVQAQESENVVVLQRGNGRLHGRLIGPRIPKTGEEGTVEFTLEIDADLGTALLHSEGTPKTLALAAGQWSDWLKVKFKLGLLNTVNGAVRFYVPRVTPEFELYASPINFVTENPMFPISAPWEYASDLQKHVGMFYTTGMVEDHTGLNNGRFDEAAYLDQCDQVVRERQRMMEFELDRTREGLFFVLFDTPDRLQHMFWRFGEPGHPANRRHGGSNEYRATIRDHYRRCDEIVGAAMARADDRTLVVVLSDHGFSSFQRGFHINAWLQQNGFLALKSGATAGEAAGDFFTGVDWARTQAYAVGIGSVYLNLKGRESQGIVEADQAAQVTQAIVRGLTGLVDPARGEIAVRGVATRAQVYSGACAAESPDLVLLFNEGYRASWSTALGGIPADLFEDNIKKWGGDHIIDPLLVPGVLFMNAPFAGERARLLDLAPTILTALGVPPASAMEGTSLLS